MAIAGRRNLPRSEEARMFTLAAAAHNLVRLPKLLGAVA
jgi:hypothetical protein